MTHTELCYRAEKWLMGTAGCSFAFRELVSIAGEIPDAIGWKGGNSSYLVECKTSRGDFLADSKKWFRRTSRLGMGVYRYMMCPKGIISPEEVPEGWGLLYCLPKITRKVKAPRPLESNTQAEMTLLGSALRRVYLRGDLEKIYDRDTLYTALQTTRQLVEAGRKNFNSKSSRERE